MYVHLVKYDGEKWMAACEVGIDETYPIGFEQERTRADGTAFGWEPIEFTTLIPWLNDAIKTATEIYGEDFEIEPGEYRLDSPHLVYVRPLEEETT